jgi:hypothetical protein
MIEDKQIEDYTIVSSTIDEFKSECKSLVQRGYIPYKSIKIKYSYYFKDTIYTQIFIKKA